MVNVFCAVSFMLLCFSQVIMWSSFYEKCLNYKSVVFYAALLIMFSLGMLNYFYATVFLRMIFAMLLFCVCNWLIFRTSINEVVVSTILGQSFMIFADIIVSIVLMSFFHVDFKNIRDGYIITYTGNILVSFLLIIMSRLVFVRRLYSKLILFTDRIKSYYLFFLCSFVIISINYVLVSTFYEVGTVFILCVNSILILIYIFIVFRSLHEKNSRLFVQSQNSLLLQSLRQYEDMVDRQRVDNHENKNQLLIIKNMIKKKDNEVIKYIDTIVKNQKEDDESLYTRVMTIPSGGLQGIIYQKMLIMKDEHIKFSLDVGRGVRDFELDKLSMDDNYRLCKIIGVFLDNAIEESLTVDNRCIMISLYVDNNDLVIEVSNRFRGKVDVDRLDESGYTTKGDGHGYGLPLVKKILSETDTFVNERSVKRNIFKQVIRIKNT